MSSEICSFSEASLFGDLERLGERGDLTRGELVVDELPGRARADRPEQIHLAAHRRKRRARRLVGLGVAADKEPQFAALRRRTAAADRRIEEADIPWLERDGASSRIQSGVNVLDSTPIAPLFAPASAPSAPEPDAA